MQFSDAKGVATPNTPTNDVTLVGSDTTKGVTIHNVAAGVAPTDAVNVGQLNNAIVGAEQYTDNAVNQLRGVIDDNRKRASAGAASGMAMANMPQAYIPGKSMMSAGVANYDGQTALSIGMSSLSDNGRWVIKASGSVATSGKVGIGAGAGFHW